MKTFDESTQEIATECRNPETAIDSMRHVRKQVEILQKAYYAADLLRWLNKKRTPLKNTEDLCNKACSKIKNKNRATQMKELIMKWKLKDATKTVQEEKKKMTTVMRENNKVLRKENVNVNKSFDRVWKREKIRIREELKKKKNKKKNFLHQKELERRENRNREATLELEEEIEGIIMTDQEIPDSFYTRSKPTCHGNVKLTTAEEKVLELPPKFTTYEKINVEECEAQVEKGLAKLRWTKKKKNETEEEEEDGNEEDEENRVWPLDLREKTLDLRAMRPTDMPFNKRIYLPPPVDTKTETEMQNLKNRLINVTKEYTSRNKTQDCNLTEEEKKGLKSIKKREETVVYQTDKSGKFSVDSKENYKEACRIHTEKDISITEETHKRMQEEANAHAGSWVKMLRIGENGGTGSQNRVKSNMLVEECPPPPLYSLRKDHKEYDDEVKGPPTRPVCGATTAYNGKLSYLLSQILEVVWKEPETVCLSTEEMLAEFDKFNSKGIEEKVSIGSADVKALYPSIDIEFAVEKVGEMMEKSPLSIEGVNEKEVGLYLALNKKEEELKKLNLLDVCPRRKTNRGRPPSMTGCATSEKEENRHKPWKEPERNPGEDTKRKMMIEAMKIALTFVMKNHVYKFDDELKQQNKGGPIGLELTGVIAQILMSWWDERLIEKMKANNMNVWVYSRYVDDINVVVSRKGEEQEPTGESEDEICMKKIVALGNEIHPSIQLEVDYPSNHQDMKIPILDVKVWVESKKKTNEGERESQKETYQVMYEYYTKDVSSKHVVNARSALPWNSKRTILTQETLRIMLNCNRELPRGEVNKHLNGLMLRMQYSGYDRKFRTEVTKSALSAYKKIVEKEEKNEQPIHRPKDWKKTERAEEKRKKKGEWYKKGKGKENEYDSVIFVPTTPKAELRKRYEEEIKNSKLKIRVVETAGKTLKKHIQRSDPFKREKCGNTKCLVCTTEGKGPCRTTGTTYEIVCEAEGCEATYIGETARSAFVRGEEHRKGLEKREKSSVLWRHVQEEHDSQTPAFKMSVTGVYGNDAMLRQISEAVKIRNNNNLINARGQWHEALLPTMRTGSHVITTTGPPFALRSREVLTRSSPDVARPRRQEGFEEV